MRNNKNRIASIAGGIALVGMASANAVVIDFEGFDAGTIIDDDIEGITVSALSFGASSPDVAVIFDTNNPTGGDDDLGAPFINLGTDAELSPGNVLILQENDPCDASACDEPDDNGGGGRFTFDFAVPVTLNSINFFDVEADEAGAPIEGTGMIIAAMGEDGMMGGLLGTWEVPGTGGDNTWATLDLGGVSGVTQLTITLFGSGAIDDLDVTPIPVPAAVWLFGSALAGFAGIARRRAARIAA